MTKIGILFVCLGNICRSPLAEGVFAARAEARGLTHRFHIDSAGTGRWHVGEAPDPRAMAVAKQNGLDISHLRARQIVREDLSRFDSVLCMAGDIIAEIEARRWAADRTAPELYMQAAGLGAIDVPDPYYGGPEDYEAVYRMVSAASDRLLDRFAG